MDSKGPDEPNLENLRLRSVQKGSGNTLGISAKDILARESDIIAAGFPVFKIYRLKTGELSVRRCTIQEVRDLPKEKEDKTLFVISKDWEQQIPKALDPFEEQLSQYASFSEETRVHELGDIRTTIENLHKLDLPAEVQAQTIMDAVERTFLINKVSLKNRTADVGLFEKTVANETRFFVSAVLKAVEESDLAGPLIECFSGLSNGQTVNHVKRVFTLMLGFLQYYEKEHQHRLGQKVRLVFDTFYRPFYERLLPDLQEIWMVADNLIPLVTFTPPELKEFGLGAFLHDIGKVANIDYFESDSGFDLQQIRQHVFVGSGLVIMNYGADHERARAMVGDHHNALGHPDGYGVTRWERSKSLRSLKPLQRCISADYQDFVSGRALGYLPSEMLAVVDVYDAMTDASRTYKKVLNPAEALDFIYRQFVCREKMDPVLFDIFADFLRHNKVDAGSEHGLRLKF